MYINNFPSLFNNLSTAYLLYFLFNQASIRTKFYTKSWILHTIFAIRYQKFVNPTQIFAFTKQFIFLGPHGWTKKQNPRVQQRVPGEIRRNHRPHPESAQGWICRRPKTQRTPLLFRQEGRLPQRGRWGPRQCDQGQDWDRRRRRRGGQGHRKVRRT